MQEAKRKKELKKQARSRVKKPALAVGESSALLEGQEGEDDSEDEGEGSVVKGKERQWTDEQDLLLVKAVGEVWDGFWAEVAKKVEAGKEGGVWKAGECERRFEEL